MANPQTYNGYTSIANEIMDALVKTRIPGEARQVLDCIIRKTYGFHKKEDWISLSQFETATGLCKPSIVRALRLLLAMNIISKNANGISENANNKNLTYSFQKDYEKWKPLAKKLIVSENANDHLRKRKKSLAKTLPTKDIPKETITKDRDTIFEIEVDGMPIKIEYLKITNDELTQLEDAYADKIDCGMEMAKAENYMAEHPQKKYRNHKRYLHNWFMNALRYQEKNKPKLKKLPKAINEPH